MSYLVLAGMFIFSLGDIKYRVIPAVEVVFFGVVLLVVRDHDMLQVSVVVFSVLFGVYPRIHKVLGVAIMFFPFAWPTLLFSYGVRNMIIGKPDLYVVGILSLLFTQDIVIASVLGAYFWIAWWKRNWKQKPIPLVPGMSLGALTGLGVRWLLSFAGVV